jgi:mannose-1-phosphate guanylyltransferase
MKHLTGEELDDRFDAQESDVIDVFDEEAMVVEQSRYQAESAETDATRAHPQDECYYITAGSGKMRVRDETREVAAGDVIYVDQWVEHGFFDIDGEIRVLKVFASP